MFLSLIVSVLSVFFICVSFLVVFPMHRKQVLTWYAEHIQIPWVCNSNFSEPRFLWEIVRRPRDPQGLMRRSQRCFKGDKKSTAHDQHSLHLRRQQLETFGTRGSDKFGPANSLWDLTIKLKPFGETSILFAEEHNPSIHCRPAYKRFLSDSA